jgi:hypothetical protein
VEEDGGAAGGRDATTGTPVGLRSLARSHPDYERQYFGDLRARDAAFAEALRCWMLTAPVP